MPTIEYEVTHADWEASRSMRLETAKSLNYSQAAKDEDECINHFFLTHPDAVLLVSENGKERTIRFKTEWSATKFRICTVNFLLASFIVH